MKYQQWNIAQRSQEAFQAMERQGVPSLVAATLCARGLTDLEEAKGLLSSGEDQLCDPFLMKDMDLAVARVSRALGNGEKIAIYGDYDVDGITSTCLLTHYLRAQGGDVCYYIPNRLSEGYGVNNEAVDRLAEQGVGLIITVDCGITALSEVRYAASLGIDVIITDHHECKEKIPAAVAVVDPHRKDCPYPFKDLAGVGVALKLVMALGGEKRYRALFLEYADLAAVGTVADVMKLLGENRTIVRVGLNHLKKTRRRGLYALMVEAGTLNRAITSTTVGYCLSPRINAAGRMGRAAMAAELILTEDPVRAETLAQELCELNRQRQAVELDIFNQCLALLAGKKQYDCLVLADKAWHQGVVGIVASRLAEQFACPVFMICLQADGKGKGSCRSYGGFNLFCALDQCADLLEGYGGHALAAGFSIKEENIPAFRARMEEIVRGDTGGEEMVSTLQIDGEISNTAVLTVEQVEALSMLEPYGAGNPKPVFSLSGVTITCMSDVGGGRHLKMRASRDGRTVDMIFFSVTRAKSGLTVGDRADVAFYPQINEYRGSRTVQLHLVDLRPAYSPQQLSEQALYRKYRRGERLSPCEARTMIPHREEFAALWRYLANRQGEVVEVPVRLARKVAHEADLWESTLHTMICLEVLESFDLVTIRPEEGGALRIRLRKRRGTGKVSLYQAPMIKKLQTIAWGEERDWKQSNMGS
ncbi:MAG: single-stranded-DNA-specific exonuclease RecJ [Clostridiales bacterium]|nr:single-stranded-DNA-specific exonuclease RecJ [Clostridiales bacterium]MDY4172604.1 single-stranded-DNA-specific exonuclease RecJ [Evtepia sp.]